MTTRAIRTTAGLLTCAMLLSVGLATPAAAAKKEKKPRQKAVPAVIETMNGSKYKMASAKIAKRVTRIDDAAGDQRTNEGDPAPDAPAHTDLARVYVASGEVQRKLLTKMEREHPDGAAGAFYGKEADWDVGDKLVMVAAEMAARRPASAAGQQLQIGVDGEDAPALQVGSDDDELAGLSRFSLSGVFNNGAWRSGTTDVSGHVPGGEVDWYNAESGVLGYYDARRKTWYAAVPRPADARRVTVTVRSSTAAGEVVDRLELPGGGIFVDLADPTGGLSTDAGLPPLSCRALETYSAGSGDPALTDPDATLIRYTAGVIPATDSDDAAKLLAPARAAVGPVPMLLTPVGSEDEPLEVTGQLEATPGIDAFTLTMEVPPGQWTFEPAEDAQVELPNGEALIDHRTLTGRSGIATGPGLDGVVAGDPSCGWGVTPAEDGAAEEPAASDAGAGGAATSTAPDATAEGDE